MISKKWIFKNGPVEVIKSLDWSKIDFKKAIKNSTFELDTVNWKAINNNDKAATKAYKAINWETQDFTSIPKELAWDKIDLKKAASDTFALEVVDWTTINNNDKAATRQRLQSNQLGDSRFHQYSKGAGMGQN